MKKVCALILVVMMCVSASSVYALNGYFDPAGQMINLSRSFQPGPTGVQTAAKWAVRGTQRSVVGWSTVLLPWGTVSNLVVGMAASYAAGAIVMWLSERGYEWVTDHWEKPSGVRWESPYVDNAAVYAAMKPGGELGASGAWKICCGWDINGPTQFDVYISSTVGGPSYGDCCYNNTCVGFSSAYWNCNCGHGLWNIGGASSCSPGTYSRGTVINPKTTAVRDSWSQVPGPNIPATVEEVETQFATDAANDTGSAREAAVEILTDYQPMLDSAHEAWPATVPDNAAYTGTMTSPQADAVQESLNQTMPQTVKDTLTDAANDTGTEYVPDPTEEPLGDDWEYTPEQMAAAQKIVDLQIEATRKSEFEGEVADLPTLDPGEPEADEEGDYPAILQWFYDGLMALPIVSMVYDLSIDASGGSPSVSFTAPSLFGSGSQNVTMNFSQDSIMGVNYGSILEIFGNVLLAMVGVRWTIYVFKSGE